MSVSGTDGLEQELASVVRVRNRLAGTNDDLLPKILKNLLPRLLSKLEKNAMGLYEDNAAVRVEIQSQLLGTLSHALERVRGAPYMSITWVNGILCALQSQSQVARTITIALLQTSIPRTKPSALPMGKLWENLDQLHRKMLQDQDNSEGLVNEWKSASWLCLDAMAVLANMRPKLDWTLVDFDIHFYEEPEENALVATPNAVEAVLQDGLGVFDLYLDIMLFQVNDATGLSNLGRSRMTHRQNGMNRHYLGVRWNENTIAYMKELKFACFQYMVVPFQKGLFQGSIGWQRCLICVFLVMKNNSKIGRLAADCWNKVVSKQRLSKQGQQFVPMKALVCDLSMAVSLMIMVLGDAASHDILQKHAEHRLLWESVIGPRPEAQSMQRAPLPTATAVRALDFITDHFSLSDDSNQRCLVVFIDLMVAVHNLQRGVGTGAIRLMYEVHKERQKYARAMADDNWATYFRRQCVDAAFSVLNAGSRPAMPMGFDFPEDRPVAVPPADAADLAGPFNLPVVRQADGAAGPLEGAGGLVPPHFVDHLLGAVRPRNRQFRGRFYRTPTQIQRARHEMDKTKDARKAAYEIIASLLSEAPLYKSTEELQFGLPILLLGCANREDETMMPFVSKTMRAVLTSYRAVLQNESPTCEIDSLVAADGHRKGASLLPSLLETICSDSESARRLALQTIEALLLPLDYEAAYHLASYLVNAKKIGSLAKEIIRACSDRPNFHGIQDAETFEFIDTETSIDMDKISSEVERRTQRVVDETNIPASAARAVLCALSFELPNTLITLKSERAETLSRFGVARHCDCTGEETPNELNNQICEICYDDLSPGSAFGMACSHVYCRSCWKTYLESKVEGGPSSLLHAVCPADGCKERVLDEDVHAVAPELTVPRQRALLNSFIEKDPRYSYCPGPNCCMVVKSDSGKGAVECVKCETSFCFGCQNPPHEPSTCEDMKRWNKLVGDSQFWIKKNTKQCPGCDAPIEKNMGCNHMTCSRCHCEFCWLCLARMDSHLQVHECNVYEGSGDDADQHKRDVFFTERFEAHEHAEQFAKRHLEHCHSNMQRLVRQQRILDEDDAEDLLDACESLVGCRRFLKNSYVASYSMRADQETLKIFQSYQGVLECFAERLSYLTETNPLAVYNEGGSDGVHKHVRALSFYTLSARKYMERIVHFNNSHRR